MPGYTEKKEVELEHKIEQLEQYLKYCNHSQRKERLTKQLNTKRAEHKVFKEYNATVFFNTYGRAGHSNGN